MKKLTLIAIISVFISSCGVLWEYRNLHNIEDMSWSITDKQLFDFEIENDGNYEVIILIRHVHGLALPSIPIHVNLQSNGIVLDQDFQIPIKNEHGEYVGDGSVDMWDIDYTAAKSIHLTKGSHKAVVSQISDYDDLKLIMEVGLMIKKAE